MSVTLSFDIGHESIGWAAMRGAIDSKAQPEILGCGTVLFESDNCQNQTRAGFRRQRRHVAATRNRIKRLETVLVAKGLLSEAEVVAARVPVAVSPPWWLATRWLQDREQARDWTELWRVLRWYAHNRGYDGNLRWARDTDGGDAEDTQKVEKANALMAEYGTDSMAATMCAFLEVDPMADEPSVPSKYFKGQEAAFRRAVVEGEVRRILEAHRGKLPGVDAALIEGLVGTADDAWKQAGSDIVKLPPRYAGGLLFGQMIPRFDNRIIPSCRITGEKVPGKDCPEFYAYRWAMLVNNLRVAGEGEASRALKVDERAQLHAHMQAAGYFTKPELGRVLCDELGLVPANLDQMFLTPEMERALVLDPARRETMRGVLKLVWPTIPPAWHARLLNVLRRGQPQTLADWRDKLTATGVDLEPFAEAVAATATAASKRARKKTAPITPEDILARVIKLPERASGRSPYTRELMAQAAAEVMAGKDPKAHGGCLEETPEVITRHLSQALEQQTNNHLVRHRMLVFGRLLEQCLDTFAEPGESPRIVIEVIRELQEFSGKTPQEKAKIIGLKMKGHNDAVKYLETKRAETGLNFEIGAGLIKKVRLAQDLDWTCPFSGKKYCLTDILEKRVDREHIIPRSWRPSDSLDSLVLTFSEINRRKGARLAWQFIQDEGGGDLFTPAEYQAFVERLKPKSDPRKNRLREVIDDDLRRWRRQQFLLTERYDKHRGGEGFVAGDLTRTSFLNKIAAQEALRHLRARYDPEGQRDPRELAARHIVHLPGSVTGTGRRAWNLLGCLSSLVSTGRPLNKTELRGKTHLHHALDAIAAGLADHYLPNHGDAWTLLSRRKLNSEQAAHLRHALGLPVQLTANDNWRIDDLPVTLKDDIREALAAQNVVQHLPRTYRGLKVQQNTWRVLGPDPKHPGKRLLSQATRDEKQRRHRKHGSEKTTKLLGYTPNAPDGKLARLKGALIIDGNYGVALDPEPVVIAHLKVWQQLQALRAKNGGRPPRILRKGQVFRIPEPTDGKPYKYSGRWRVRSIKDAAQNIMLDISPVHAVKDMAINVLLKTLLRRGLEIETTDMLGPR